MIITEDSINSLNSTESVSNEDVKKLKYNNYHMDLDRSTVSSSDKEEKLLNFKVLKLKEKYEEVERARDDAIEKVKERKIKAKEERQWLEKMMGLVEDFPRRNTAVDAYKKINKELRKRNEKAVKQLKKESKKNKEQIKNQESISRRLECLPITLPSLAETKADLDLEYEDLADDRKILQETGCLLAEQYQETQEQKVQLQEAVIEILTLAAEHGGVKPNLLSEMLEIGHDCERAAELQLAATEAEYGPVK